MSGKVLLNVYSIHVKNDLLSIFIENAVDVMEVQNEHDLIFKYNLLKNNLNMYIHEFDETNHKSSMEQLRRIDLEKVRCIVMIHEYSSKIIDETLLLNVKDIIVLPIDKENLRRKILSPVHRVKSSTSMPKAPLRPLDEGKLVVAKFNYAPLNLEITRCTRGNYPLSLVLVSYSDIEQRAFDVFEEELRLRLRTTDVILKFDQNRLLIMCPFTPKNNLVEVENKVREAFSTVRFKGYKNSNMYLYGVTFPDDGGSSRELVRLMKDGIHDSKLFSELEGPLNRMNQRDVRNKLRRNY